MDSFDIVTASDGDPILLLRALSRSPFIAASGTVRPVFAFKFIARKNEEIRNLVAGRFARRNFRGRSYRTLKERRVP
jgi:hypothetical protein